MAGVGTSYKIHSNYLCRFDYFKMLHANHTRSVQMSSESERVQRLRMSDYHYISFHHHEFNLKFYFTKSKKETLIMMSKSIVWISIYKNKLNNLIDRINVLSNYRDGGRKFYGW